MAEIAGVSTRLLPGGVWRCAHRLSIRRYVSQTAVIEAILSITMVDGDECPDTPSMDCAIMKESTLVSQRTKAGYPALGQRADEATAA